MAEAKADWKQLPRDFYPSFIKKVNEAQENIEEIEDFKKGIPTDEVCEREGCGKPMVKKIGRFGYFLACSGFPDCRNAKSLPIADCPVPDCDGKVVARRSKKRRMFYVCDNDECDYILWNKPLKDKCPQCGYYLYNVRKKRNPLKKCSNKECDYQINEQGERVYA